MMMPTPSTHGGGGVLDRLWDDVEQLGPSGGHGLSGLVQEMIDWEKRCIGQFQFIIQMSEFKDDGAGGCGRLVGTGLFFSQNSAGEQ